MNLIRVTGSTALFFAVTLGAYQDLISLKASTKKGGSNPASVIQKHAQDKAVVLFYKPSCPYCIYLESKFKTLAHQNKQKAQFIMLDIQQNDQPYKAKYGFSTVPTVMYFEKGKTITSHGSDNKTITVADMQKKVDLLS